MSGSAAWPAIPPKVLADSLRQQHVGEPIIERVLRLNPIAYEGAILRGLRRSSDERAGMSMWGYVSKGAVLRRYGREGWAQVPRAGAAIIRRGKRRYVNLAILDRLCLGPAS